MPLSVLYPSFEHKLQLYSPKPAAVDKISNPGAAMSVLPRPKLVKVAEVLNLVVAKTEMRRLDTVD